MNHKKNNIRLSIANYYTEKIRQFGSTPKGVDWNSSQSQELRFAQLLKICSRKTNISINDVGCGYGALYQFMSKRGFSVHYKGYDLSKKMIDEANKSLGTGKNVRFYVGDELRNADYSVASGIFNVKMQYKDSEWKKHIYEILDKLYASSSVGFAFNMLTSFSDKDKMRKDLYYANPGSFFTYCMKNFSRHVSLLHDYGLYEFTVLVKKVLDN